MATRTRSLAPKMRSACGRNVTPPKAPAVAVVVAAVLRKSRRVTRLRDGIGRSLLGGEPAICPGDVRLQRVAVMDQHTVAQQELAASGNRVAPVATAIAGELFDAERIGGEQPVGARVPVGGRPRVLRVIEDG